MISKGVTLAVFGLRKLLSNEMIELFRANRLMLLFNTSVPILARRNFISDTFSPGRIRKMRDGKQDFLPS